MSKIEHFNINENMNKTNKLEVEITKFCDEGEFFNTVARSCDNCPDGEYQTVKNHRKTHCKAHLTSDDCPVNTYLNGGYNKTTQNVCKPQPKLTEDDCVAGEYFVTDVNEVNTRNQVSDRSLSKKDVCSRHPNFSPPDCADGKYLINDGEMAKLKNTIRHRPIINNDVCIPHPTFIPSDCDDGKYLRNANARTNLGNDLKCRPLNKQDVCRPQPVFVPENCSSGDYLRSSDEIKHIAFDLKSRALVLDDVCNTHPKFPNPDCVNGEYIKQKTEIVEIKQNMKQRAFKESDSCAKFIHYSTDYLCYYNKHNAKYIKGPSGKNDRLETSVQNLKPESFKFEYNKSDGTVYIKRFETKASSKTSYWKYVGESLVVTQNKEDASKFVVEKITDNIFVIKPAKVNTYVGIYDDKVLLSDKLTKNNEFTFIHCGERMSTVFVDVADNVRVYGAQNDLVVPVHVTSKQNCKKSCEDNPSCKSIGHDPNYEKCYLFKGHFDSTPLKHSGHMYSRTSGNQWRNNAANWWSANKANEQCPDGKRVWILDDVDDNKCLQKGYIPKDKNGVLQSSVTQTGGNGEYSPGAWKSPNGKYVFEFQHWAADGTAGIFVQGEGILNKRKSKGGNSKSDLTNLKLVGNELFMYNDNLNDKIWSNELELSQKDNSLDCDLHVTDDGNLIIRNNKTKDVEWMMRLGGWGNVSAPLGQKWYKYNAFGRGSRNVDDCIKEYKKNPDTDRTLYQIGHRNENHGQKHYKNTCYAFVTNDNSDTVGTRNYPLEDPNVHSMHCVDENYNYVKCNEHDILIARSDVNRGEVTGSITTDGYLVVFQGDGNWVVYKGSVSNYTPIWSTGTYSGKKSMYMQGDGNLVIYSPTRPVWASGRYGGGSRAPYRLYFNKLNAKLFVVDRHNKEWWHVFTDKKCWVKTNVNTKNDSCAVDQGFSVDKGWVHDGRGDSSKRACDQRKIDMQSCDSKSSYSFEKPYCVLVPGVGTPRGFFWANRYAYRWRGQHVEQSHKEGKITLNNGDNTLHHGYNYFAFTMTQGSGCGHYFLFGKSLPSDDYVADKFCSYGRIDSGIKPDTTCSKISRKPGQPGGTTWKIHSLNT